jgi:hypothetical protein
MGPGPAASADVAPDPEGLSPVLRVSVVSRRCAFFHIWRTCPRTLSWSPRMQPALSCSEPLPPSKKTTMEVGLMKLVGCVVPCLGRLGWLAVVAHGYAPLAPTFATPLRHPSPAHPPPPPPPAPLPKCSLEEALKACVRDDLRGQARLFSVGAAQLLPPPPPWQPPWPANLPPPPPPRHTPPLNLDAAPPKRRQAALCDPCILRKGVSQGRGIVFAAVLPCAGTGTTPNSRASWRSRRPWCHPPWRRGT